MSVVCIVLLRPPCGASCIGQFVLNHAAKVTLWRIVNLFIYLFLHVTIGDIKILISTAGRLKDSWPKNKNYNLLTLKLNIKEDILKNMGNQTVDGPHW